MKQPLKQVNFYKRALVQGCVQGFKADDALSLHLENPAGGAWFAAFDTQDEESTYNRLVVDGDFSGVKLEILAAVAPAAPTEKMAMLMTLAHVREVNRPDILLHDLVGRWIFLCVAVVPQDGGNAVLRGVHLEFPRYSFTQYFPEIYQQDDFFRRYIAIFQSLYLDLEHRVEEIPLMLDYTCAPDEQVEALAAWLGIDTAGGIFGPEQMRILIKESALYQGGKGTRSALEGVVELACGVRPRIVEYFQWGKLPMSAARRRLYENLYGTDSNTFCVILDLTNRDTPLPVNQAQLENLIRAYSPLGAQHKLVFLRPCSYTDNHCYLEVNSCLSTPEKAAVDGVTLGGYFTVG